MDGLTVPDVRRITSPKSPSIRLSPERICPTVAQTAHAVGQGSILHKYSLGYGNDHVDDWRVGLWRRHELGKQYRHHGGDNGSDCRKHPKTDLESSIDAVLFVGSIHIA